MIHNQDVKRYRHCPRLFWLARENGVSVIPYLRFQESLMSLVCQKLKVSQEFVGKIGDDKEVALKAMEVYQWLKKARFEYDGWRVKVPLMKKMKRDGLFILFLEILSQKLKN
ncbi:MAG: hypothetical protein ACK5LZ_03095 [Anaerorhabdus sp.]